MKIENHILIDELVSLTDQSIEFVKQFKELDPSVLNYKSAPGSWSMLESIEHLNLYGNFYIPEIQTQLNGASTTRDSLFRTSIMGDYFVKLIRVKNGKIRKIKTAREMDPNNSTLTITTLNRFIKQQEKLRELLELAVHKDLTKTKTAISLTHFFRLRMGDTLRFVVYHTERHILQARHVLQSVPESMVSNVNVNELMVAG